MLSTVLVNLGAVKPYPDAVRQRAGFGTAESCLAARAAARGARIPTQQIGNRRCCGALVQPEARALASSAVSRNRRRCQRLAVPGPVLQAPGIVVTCEHVRRDWSEDDCKATVYLYPSLREPWDTWKAATRTSVLSSSRNLATHLLVPAPPGRPQGSPCRVQSAPRVSCSLCGGVCCLLRPGTGHKAQIERAAAS